MQSYKVTFSEVTLSEEMDQKTNEGEKGEAEEMKGEQNDRCSIDEVNFFDSVEETNCTCSGCQIRCPLHCPLVLSVVLLSVDNVAWVVVDYFLCFSF